LSERWWRRRKRYNNPWFGNFFEEADHMERMMDDMLRQALGNPAEREKVRRRYINQFGDFHSTHRDGSQTCEEYEPLIDVFVEEIDVIVVAELLGINKDSIEINATEDTLTITVKSPKHSYYKELNLPAKVDQKSSAASYRNGVLEVRLKKLIGERLLLR